MATGKIKKPVTEFTSYSDVYWWGNTWTAPSSGIAVVKCSWKTGGGSGYWYIKQLTDNYLIAHLSTPNANGLTVTTAFPVIKGKEYGTDSMDKVDTVWVRFFPFQNS